MSEFIYLEEKQRYLKSIGNSSCKCNLSSNCKDCVLSHTKNGFDKSCNRLECENPKEADKLIRRWSEKHPVITNIDKYAGIMKKNIWY